MNKFVVVSLAVMAWAFYELSGGSDFEPKYRRDIAQAQTPKTLVSHEPARITPTPIEPVVTLASAAVPTERRTQIETVPVAPANQTPLHNVDAASVTSFQTPKVASLSLTETFAAPDTKIGTQPTLAAVNSHDLILIDPKKDLRSVRGSRVNLRGGPGTSFAVLGVLTRGQEVEVLQDEGKGWVKLRDHETGRVGWMAGKMLAQIAE
ncbi:Bacterial SH3 domain protein [Shimia sp. SK013]|uniref:SH3 domain-containing protein n=1 Tax=Shimia sp. SK013 TaxID=1389006 RepID=UPI0006B63580|nr:SH3 domain-containing protein [Shimia sp. SK013]KPA20578.1 Bacterial SH3 domain protein [Shimia sp. SK013]